MRDRVSPRRCGIVLWLDAVVCSVTKGRCKGQDQVGKRRVGVAGSRGAGNRGGCPSVLGMERVVLDTECISVFAQSGHRDEDA